MSQDYMSESQKLEFKSLSAQTDEALHDAAIWMQRALAAEEKLSECIASHQKTNARLHEAEENLGKGEGMSAAKFKSLLSDMKSCPRCRGRGVISVKHGTTFCTDSADERSLAYHEEDCPDCLGRLASAFASPELIGNAIAAEREACAKIADEYGREGDRFAKEYACETADELAARIRARGKA